MLGKGGYVRCKGIDIVFSCFSKGQYRLSDNDVIGIGSERCCYSIKEKSLCVKVAHGKGERYKSQNKKEYEYYQLLESRGVDFSRLPRCYGWLWTNKGKGLVFEMVVDEDGSLSLTLEEYINRYGWSDTVANELQNLRSYLLKNCIIVCDLKERNVICQKKNNGDFVFKLIDGVGSRDAVPLANYVKFFARRKILRHWSRFEKRISGFK